MTIWRIWQQSWASLCLIISENFGVWYFWESLSLIFLGMFDFDIFENTWVWYFWDAKWLQVWNWWRGFFVAPAWSTKSWIAPNVGYQNLWEFAKSKTQPLQTNLSRTRNLVKLILLWKGVMQRWLWKYSKDLPCSAVFLVTESESGKWIDFMIAIALFMGLKMLTALLMYWYWYFPAQINLTW